jgi:hypothetical protein
MPVPKTKKHVKSMTYFYLEAMGTGENVQTGKKLLSDTTEL